MKASNFKTNRQRIKCFCIYSSKALNDSPEISEQTKIKIKEYAKLKIINPM
jgi:hypothetical protein